MSAPFDLLATLHCQWLWNSWQCDWRVTKVELAFAQSKRHAYDLSCSCHDDVEWNWQHAAEPIVKSGRELEAYILIGKQGRQDGCLFKSPNASFLLGHDCGVSEIQVDQRRHNIVEESLERIQLALHQVLHPYEARRGHHLDCSLGVCTENLIRID
jgi:exoribonuclease II